MDELLSPRQVAKAIGVSESSLKRWCDRGLISTERTAGGHRRMRLGDVLAYLRQSDHKLVEPSVLGLASAKGSGERVLSRASDQFADALLNGNEDAAMQVVYDLFLAHVKVSEIIDVVVTGAFRGIGAGWECGEVDIYEERRGCQICERVLHSVASALPKPFEDAPIAIGGAVSGDQYTLPSASVELVLRDLGWRATSLGNDLPFASLQKAVTDAQPRLFWVSTSYIEDEEAYIAGINALYDFTASRGVALLLGGRAITKEVQARLRYTVFCENMDRLTAFAESIYRKPELRIASESSSAS